jgi:TPR repeat protein
MKKYITTLCALLLTTSFASNAVTNEEIIEIETYNIQLKSALRLYQDEDYEKALPALEIFAKRGNKTSQYIVGVMYLNGQGMQQDLMKSYAWLTVANEQRSKKWKKPLKMLNEKLPEEFLESAGQEAANYVSDFGVKAQRMKCRNVKTLGSKKGVHQCKKLEIRSGYYYVSNPTYLVAN